MSIPANHIDRMEPGYFFCFGLGYSALALAEQLAAKGWRIGGTCRSPEKQAALRALGYEIHLFQEGLEIDPRMLADVTHLLSSVPPGATGDPVAEALKPQISALKGMSWIGYLSTTGVYGDRNGGWVDENSALEPTGPRGEKRVAAERDWQSLGEASGTPVHTFRLAGIYGPTRNAVEMVRKGGARRIDKPGQVFSRIHVDDITSILLASMAQPGRSGTLTAYNCCDDNPAPPEEVIAYACSLLDVEPPPLIPFDQAELSPMARSFYRDNKRVSNTRIKNDLGVTLTWPDYRDALPVLAGKA